MDSCHNSIHNRWRHNPITGRLEGNDAGIPMTIHHGGKRALVLTVGTGNVDMIDQTLIKPMLKSIELGEWDRIILLPSRMTEKFAQDLQKRISNPAVASDPLPEQGQENNADACFGYFDSVLARLIADGFTPSDIVVDFTRGTKAMSAALVLAAVGRNIPVLRYVHSEQRDERGMVVPGAEKIGEIRTILATERRRLDLAAALMRRGDFVAVIELLPDLDGPFAELLPEELRVEAAALRAAAQIYAAWDRLDYKASADAMERCGPTAAKAGSFAPTREMGEWLHRLAQKSDQSDHAAMAAYLRALACDLLANAERRLRDRHFEDVLVRSYRVLELIGQIRLFDRGYDSAALPPDDAEVKKFRAKLEKKGEHGFGVNKRGRNKGTLTAPRELAARLLKRLGDPLASGLLGFDKKREVVKVGNRNSSLLIHGFTTTAPAEEPPLRMVLADLECLLNEDDSRTDERLKVARSLSFSGG